MCTAIRLTTRDHYFGRNLDLEYSYQETVAITPRRYPFHFRHEGTSSDHFAMIGMAFVVGNLLDAKGFDTGDAVMMVHG